MIAVSCGGNATRLMHENPASPACEPQRCPSLRNHVDAVNVPRERCKTTYASSGSPLPRRSGLSMRVLAVNWLPRSERHGGLPACYCSMAAGCRSARRTSSGSCRCACATACARTLLSRSTRGRRCVPPPPFLQTTFPSARLSLCMARTLSLEQESGVRRSGFIRGSCFSRCNPTQTPRLAFLARSG